MNVARSTVHANMTAQTLKDLLYVVAAKVTCFELIKEAVNEWDPLPNLLFQTELIFAK